MISRAELRKLARGRLRDAEVLFQGKRYSGFETETGLFIKRAYIIEVKEVPQRPVRQRTKKKLGQTIE